ncbi:MAG: GNAT family N-acetyltransferase [bacterium]
MKIIDLDPSEKEMSQQVAKLLVEGFKEVAPNAWSDMTSAVKEVHRSFADDRISRIAVEGDVVVGWIGGIKQYDGNVWELHPLVVHPDHRRKGIGRALVSDLESLVRERGGITLWAGTDDESDMTSICGIDLYPDVLKKLMEIKNVRGHPYEFYLKLGFEIVGALPDANGFGKPDIFVAKRV